MTQDKHREMAQRLIETVCEAAVEVADRVWREAKIYPFRDSGQIRAQGREGAAKEIRDTILCLSDDEDRNEHLFTRIATALTNLEAEALARGRDEAAEIVRRHISGDDIASRRLRESLTVAILADSGPSYDSRIRAEIAEAVGAISLIRETETGFESRSLSIYRDDVLAAIEGSGK